MRTGISQSYLSPITQRSISFQTSHSQCSNDANAFVRCSQQAPGPQCSFRHSWDTSGHGQGILEISWWIPGQTSQVECGMKFWRVFRRSFPRLFSNMYLFGDLKWTQPTKVTGTLRGAVRSRSFARLLSGRHMECAYYFDVFWLCRNTDHGVFGESHSTL